MGERKRNGVKGEVMVWPCQLVTWLHDFDLSPYANLPDRLRSIGISWLLELNAMSRWMAG
jgi:hypothetical protein